MSDKPNEEPKLIIDEDWKTQVQREKEELKQQQAAAESQAADVETTGAETIRVDGDDESAAQGSASQATAGGDAAAKVTSAAADSAGEPNDASDEFGGPPPPASLMLLANTLATQAMGAMGLIADDKGEPIPANFDFARHFIDMLAVLEEKTKGNVTDEEAAFLKEALHQLRMAFVAVSKKKQS